MGNLFLSPFNLPIVSSISTIYLVTILAETLKYTHVTGLKYYLFWKTYDHQPEHFHIKWVNYNNLAPLPQFADKLGTFTKEAANSTVVELCFLLLLFLFLYYCSVILCVFSSTFYIFKPKYAIVHQSEI